MAMSDDDRRVDWLSGRLLPVFAAPQALQVYTVRGLPYDLQLSIATLAGLINRWQAQLYLDWRIFDLLWLEEVLPAVPHTVSPLTGDAILLEMLARYGERIQGYVIYDPACLDSVNVATMITAQRDGFVVSPTLAERLREQGCKLPLIDDLRVYAWRSRVQVYRWAWQHLFAGAMPGLIAGLSPEIAVGIRPYLVATKTFIYWLHPLSILPERAQGWLSERALLQRLLRNCAPGTLHLGWFLQEGSGVTLASQHAIPVVASDYFANLETWSGRAPLAAVPSSQQAPALPSQEPALSALASKTYVAFTMSEGDNLQYIQEVMLRHWRHPLRGSVPIGWPVPLILPQAAPALWDYYLRTASHNDEFLAAPSGLGYSYPSKWDRRYLQSYLTQSGLAMQRMGLRLLAVLESNFWLHPRLIYRAVKHGAGMALIHPTLQRELARELRPFGLHGIVSGGGQARAAHKHIHGVPVIQNIGIAKEVAQTVALIRQATPRQQPAFLNVYVLAWKMGPAELQAVARELGDAYQIVPPGALVHMYQDHWQSTS